MTDFTHEWIAKREQLEKAATEGPWWWDQRGDLRPTPHDEYGLDRIISWDAIEEIPVLSDGDAEFIADARTSLPAALAALTAVLGATEGKTEHHGHTPLDGDDCCLAADVRDAVEAALRGES